MSRRLQSKVAIITGSSSGLGRSIALRYAREGAHVICSDLQPSPRIASAPPSQQPATHQTPTHELIASRGGISTFVRADVSSAADMASLVDQAVIWGNTGRLDVMVNNAGIALEANNPGPVHETEESVWDKTMAVNAKSVFLGCKYAIAKMMKQEMWSEKEHGGGEHVGAYEEEAGGKPESRGWVVNISSIYGIVGGFNAPSYSASKGAVANLTRQIAHDYGKHGIHCNALCPGHAETAIFAETLKNMVDRGDLLREYPMGRFGTPEDVAKMAVVLAGDEASWMTGQCIGVDGGYLCR